MITRGLYIHIPFCDHICSYCDFTKFFYDEYKASLYIDQLIKEMEEKKVENVSSIYIGGGTPSSLNIAQLEKLLDYLSRFIKDGTPFTIEANAESLTLEKIILLKKYHVNRVSIGVQSFNHNLIKLMNRHHDYIMVKKVIDDLVRNGICNINCDLIYGLPGEDFEILEDDLNKILSLPITHISTYGLMINKNTILGNQKIKESSQEIYRQQYDYIFDKLKRHGFNRYEVSNFCKDGFESKHNLIYWNNLEYYGIGSGASGYLNRIRYDNTKSLDNYLKGKRTISKEEVGIQEEEFYYLMLKLRLENGFSLSEFKKIFKYDFIEKYKNQFNSLVNKHLIELNGDNLKITDENLYIMDYILDKLLF